MGKRKTMTFEKAMNIVESLSHSQGFYGRLLESMRNMDEEQKKELVNDFEYNNVQDEMDLIFYFEC